jgi:hypothetical protein
MIRSDNRIILILILVILPAGLFGFDIGVTLNNSTGFTMESTAAITQSDIVSHWFEGNFGKNYSFAYQISYSFDLDRYALFELDLLKFKGEYLFVRNTPLLISFSAGRFLFSEFSGNVLSNNADGLKLEFGLPFAAFSVSAGYLGLLQTPSSTVIMSISDLADRNIDPVPILGPLASPRLIEMVTINFPELFLHQTIDVALLFQQDLRNDTKLEEGNGRVDTQYFGAGISGPLVSPLFWDAFFYFNSGQTDNGAVTGILFGGGLDLYLKKLLSSKVSIDFIYAGGDADHSSFYEGNGDGLSTAFIPISAKPLGIVFSPKLTNVFYGAASYSIMPLSFSKNPAAKNFSIQIAGLPFFRSTSGPISEQGVNSGSDNLYLGTEMNFSINARPLSDLGFGYTMGFFFPGTAMAESTVKLLGRFNVSLSL